MSKNETAHTAGSAVFRDPAEKEQEAWRVVFNGKIEPACFNGKGPALAYLTALRNGTRKPEAK